VQHKQPNWDHGETDDDDQADKRERIDVKPLGDGALLSQAGNNLTTPRLRSAKHKDGQQPTNLLDGPQARQRLEEQKPPKHSRVALAHAVVDQEAVVI
jgi:hypothetical protein